MEISREAILNKTHYGLNVYSYVLRKYYPGETILSLSGRDCKPTKNPFNEDKPTLIVKIIDDCAKHTDSEEAIKEGDVFDFAELHFGLSGKALFEKLNEEMFLRIGEKRRFGSQQLSQPIVEEPKIEKPCVPVFSFFTKPISNTIPFKEMDLVETYHLIKGDTYADYTKVLRSISDSKEARKYKASNFDYVTFSGCFSKRNDQNLRKHSSLITLDFDHVQDLNGLKTELLKDQYFETELLFVSPSGDGLKWIIPIDLIQASHQNYFKAVANYINHQYKLEVDQSGKDISRACFLPHDPNIYINPKYV
jgi:hypothetical protein